MVIIKCNVFVNQEEFRRLWKAFVEMSSAGVILLPIGCDLVNEVPPDTEIAVVKKKGE